MAAEMVVNKLKITMIHWDNFISTIVSQTDLIRICFSSFNLRKHPLERIRVVFDVRVNVLLARLKLILIVIAGSFLILAYRQRCRDSFRFGFRLSMQFCLAKRRK